MTNRQIEPADFQGAQLDQMRSWVEGSSADGMYENADGWKTEDQYLRDLKGRVEAKLKEVGAVMQSESGEAMQNQAMPVVLWTEVTADNAKVQSEQITAQGEAFNKVKTSIPAKGEEQPVPDDNWLEEGWDSFWTGSTDAEDAQAHNEKLRQEAVQAFNSYQESTQSNVAGSPTFEPPPDGGMNVAVSGSSVPTVGGVQSVSPSGTSSAWAGGTGSGAGVSGSGVGGGAGSGGGYLGSGGGAGTHSSWVSPNTGNTGGGNTGARPVTTGPGLGGGALGMSPGGGAGGRMGGAGGSGRAGGAGGSGRGGAGSGAGGRSGPGAGGRAGALGEGGAAGRGGTGAGGRAGAPGAGGAAGARGRGEKGEDDLEHETPDYLVQDQGVFDDEMPRVAPPVFGDWEQK